MSMIDPQAAIEITGYEWVPDFARGFVRDLRPRWACEEAGIPYRERLANISDKPDWLLATQPWGQVPIMRDGDVTLFESGATLMHLGEMSEVLLPSEPQARGEAISWLFGAFNSVEPAMFEFTNVTVFARDQERGETTAAELGGIRRAAPRSARTAARRAGLARGSFYHCRYRHGHRAPPDRRQQAARGASGGRSLCRARDGTPRLQAGHGRPAGRFRPSRSGRNVTGTIAGETCRTPSQGVG